MTEIEWRVLKALAKHGPCDAKVVGENAASKAIKRPDEWARNRLTAALAKGYVERHDQSGSQPVIWSLTREGSRALKQSRAG